jgi:uncharacterized delta-60 repeat protein
LIVAAKLENSTSHVGLARITGGALDGTFGDGGKVISPAPASGFGGLAPEGLAVDPDGRIVVAGTRTNESSDDVFVQRYSAAGTLETTFGTAGLAVFGSSSSAEQGFDVVLDAAGRIVVAGTANTGASDDFLVVRFTAGGDLDSSFASGSIQSDFGGTGDDTTDAARALLLIDDKLVVTGTILSTDADFALARYALTGGPPQFDVSEGQELSLTVSYSTDTSATIKIEWGDGQIDYVAAPVGGSPVPASHAYGDNGSYAVTATLLVTGNPTAGAAVTVSNVAPAAAINAGPVAVRGHAVTFAGSIIDPGFLDTHDVRWDFGDGTVIEFHPSTDPGALVPSHTYAATGDYTVTLTVRDDENAVGSITHAISVVVAAVLPDPSGVGTALFLGGTADGDAIAVAGNGSGVTAVVGPYTGTFQPTTRIVVDAGAGNDIVVVVSSLAAWIDGGAGDDLILGGSGHDIILGGAGDDLLVGAGGRDLLIGGLGADRIVGSSNDDLLISGRTNHDQNIAALLAITAEWTSSRSYQERIENLTDGTGTAIRANGSTFLSESTVHDDGVRDVLTGSSGFDWFFANLSLTGEDDSPIKDKITGLDSEEFAEDIDFINQ